MKDIKLPTELQTGYAEQKVGKEQLQTWMLELQKYKAGKANLETRIIAAEEWWKLRNAWMERPHGAAPGEYHSQSGWLHNVLVSKHADVMDSYPQPVLLAREPGDRQQAKMLSSILPCIMEQNYFEQTYSDAMWQKLKFGTGCYKVVWDKTKLNGLGDISIEKANLLNLFWEPGVTDIQKSKLFFHTELCDKGILEELYPVLTGRLNSTAFTANKFLYDDTVNTEDKATVIEVYYHKSGKLHYCKFVGDTVLYASENQPETADRGFYDHGRFPFVLDPLFPVEGSPCGYGYVDLCRNPQTEIDLLKTAAVHNAMVGSVPRVFIRADGSINEEEYLNLNCPVVHVNGNLGEDSIRIIDHSTLDSNYVELLEQTVAELRHTSGNTETATGVTSGGATAASAIAALQEAAGKTSRDSTQGAYRAYRKIVEFCVELVRQFYGVPRQFRITGTMGTEQFTQFDNSGIQPQAQGNDFGMDMGYRLPTFDIHIEAEKKSAYTTLAQNELALQIYNAGFFNPELADQALACLDMMSFEGKDELMQKIARNQGMMKRMQLITQYAATLAHKYGDAAAMQQLAAISGNAAQPIPAGGPDEMPRAVEENKIVEKAREQSNQASQPR